MGLGSGVNSNLHHRSGTRRGRIYKQPITPGFHVLLPSNPTPPRPRHSSNLDRRFRHLWRRRRRRSISAPASPLPETASNQTHCAHKRHYRRYDRLLLQRRSDHHRRYFWHGLQCHLHGGLRLHPKLPETSKLSDDTKMAINCKCGAFDNSHCVLPRTKYDETIDAQSPRPGEQTFEKMSAGLYLGEIFRLVMLELHDRHPSS